MASLRHNAVGTVSVLFRQGGKQRSETFEDHAKAEELLVLVNKLGPDRGLRAFAALGDDTPHGITFSELWSQFIAYKGRPAAKGGVTPRTLTDYTRDYRNWIEPWFGHLDATLVDEMDVQEWVDHMTDRLAPKSVADRHMLLHSAYEYGRARSRRLVEHNPCKETVLPARAKRKNKRPKGTTTVEFRAIREAATRRNPNADDLILFLGETGWRFSEGSALAVRDVTDDGVDVWVDMTRVFRLDEAGRQYIAEDEAKSEAGFRYIRMFPDTAAMLRQRVIGKAPGDFVFTNSVGNHWNQNTFLRDTWPAIMIDAGLWTEEREGLAGRKPTPHWLRHMHVAVLAAAGVPMHEIQRRIGHEHYSTTVDVYGGRIGDISNDALAKAAALMAGTQTAPNIAPSVVQGEVIETVLGELDRVPR